MYNIGKETMATYTHTVSVVVSSAVEKALKESAKEASIAAVMELAEKYNFDAAEAIDSLGLDRMVTKRVPSKGGKSRNAMKETAAFPLPFCGVVDENRCKGIRMNHGLHTQCSNGPLTEGAYCGRCQKQADGNSAGIPTYGNMEMRQTVDLLEYHDPKGKQTLPYANVMDKLNITRDQAVKEATKFGMTIPEEHFVARVVKRGRPAKAKTAVSTVTVSDTDSEASVDTTHSVEAPKKRRGRPHKQRRLVVSTTADTDLVTQLLEAAQNQEDSDAESVTSTASEKQRKADERAAKKAAKEEAATLEKQRKADERAAKKAALADEKQRKADERAAKKAALADEKQRKADARAAKKAAKESAAKRKLHLKVVGKKSVVPENQEVAAATEAVVPENQEVAVTTEAVTTEAVVPENQDVAVTTEAVTTEAVVPENQEDAVTTEVQSFLRIRRTQ